MDYELVFEDNFEVLDLERWRHEITMGGGGNWEFQFYYNNRSSSYIKDNNLHIKPVLTTDYLGISDEELINNGNLDLWGNTPNFQCTANAFYGCQRSSNGNNIINPIMSTQLRSHQSFNFKYGKVEVMAKLPKGDWLWPAIWLLPTHHAYGGWPASGEIDIMESRGNGKEYPHGGVDTVASTLHWGPDWKNNQYNLTTKSYKLKDGTFNDRFHKYSLEWGPTYIRTYVDDTIELLNLDLTNTSFWEMGNFDQKNLFNPWKNAPNNAPFDQKYYLIFNLAVGGTNSYFPDDDKKPWKNSSPTAAKDFLVNKSKWYKTWKDEHGDDEQSAFVIDYVKVYTLK
ncbi:putative glucan binding protein [Neoconidiobolus thromboides FSU 785]|nr:putative glucan binding protein [Neoconidiobolus thromboides FSU 785]